MNARKLRYLPWLLLLLPFDLIVAVVLLISEVVGIPLRLFRREHKAAAGRTAVNDPAGLPTATIQILNWDGRHLLEECLPRVVEAVAQDGGKHEILVVDNGSTDGSVQYVKDTFPQIRVLALDQNYRFVGGNNRGIDHVNTDIVVLLNNDMIVDRGFLRPLLEGFNDPGVFAVTSQIFFADPAARRAETGKTRGRLDKGFFYLWHDSITREDEKQRTLPVFWAGGGSCALDRRKYVAIGGLDALYDPFYVEDTDLSYQAWKRGWKCLLAPSSHVVHKHRATSGPRFGADFVDNTIRRNLFLFMWKNITDVSLTVSHVLNLPRIHNRSMMAQGPEFEVKAFLRAFRQLPKAILKRLSNLPFYVQADRGVLKSFQ